MASRRWEVSQLNNTYSLTHVVVEKRNIQGYIQGKWRKEEITKTNRTSLDIFHPLIRTIIGMSFSAFYCSRNEVYKVDTDFIGRRCV